MDGVGCPCHGVGHLEQALNMLSFPGVLGVEIFQGEVLFVDLALDNEYLMWVK